MNHMTDVASMLGIELNKPFMIKGRPRDVFMLTDKGLRTPQTIPASWTSRVLTLLLTGEYEIEEKLT